MISNGKIASKNAILSAVILLGKRKTRPAALRVIGAITSEFFILQFKRKLGLYKIPVIQVDHPLDETIPFSPHHVKIYLTFTHLWLKSLLFLYREFGERALPEIADFLDEIALLYRESGKVYRKRMSTTYRPKNIGGPYFRVIHTFDPHLLCIPSLHVEIVFYNFLVITRIIDHLAEDPDRYLPEKKYLWEQAILITDSILFIKQHSVNCVSAGLFTLNNLNIGFTRELGHTIIAELFTGKGNELETAEEIKEYVRHLYDRLLERVETGDFADPEDVLVEFLDYYRLSGERALQKEA
jgi:hypothetical protein